MHLIGINLDKINLNTVVVISAGKPKDPPPSYSRMTKSISNEIVSYVISICKTVHVHMSMLACLVACYNFEFFSLISKINLEEMITVSQLHSL